jgi:signal transduction histidine kinase
VAKSLGIRHRLLTILLLGVLTSGLSLSALVRILSLTTEQRLERAREATQKEAERLAVAPLDARRVVAEPAPMAFVGMRGGVWDPTSVDGGRDALPAEWRATFDGARRASARTGEPAQGQLALPPATTLVLCVRPARQGTFAWAGYLVQPPIYLRTWQAIVILLALATGLVVASALLTVINFRRSTAALNAALLALPKNLSAPIPRPQIRELGELADGIGALARGLAQARENEDRMARELGQKERLAALGRVVAGVAHEVRNPLASIKLHLDLTAETTALPEPAARAIRTASEEIARLDRLVADLLVVAGRQMATPRPTSLGPLVRARIETLRPWWAQRAVAIELAGDATVTIDPSAVGRAIDNLVRNAVEASPARGVVRVQVVDAADAVLVRVEDDGEGVRPERAEELFEPFFTTKPDGTGLGLAISRAIARSHGGDLTYARRGGRTSFELCLARQAPAGAQA